MGNCRDWKQEMGELQRLNIRGGGMQFPRVPPYFDHWPRRITVPNFVKIGRSVAEILRFFKFSRWPPPPSWIFEIAKFYCLLIGCRASRRISVPNFVKIGQPVAIKILRFFNFSWWRPSAILDSFGAYLDQPQCVLGGLCHSAKFGYDRCSSFYNMNISIFAMARLAGMPIHAPKNVFGAIWSLKWAVISTKAKKDTPLRTWIRVIWAINRENVVSGLTCRWVA